MNDEYQVSDTTVQAVVVSHMSLMISVQLAGGSLSGEKIRTAVDSISQSFQLEKASVAERLEVVAAKIVSISSDEHVQFITRSLEFIHSNGDGKLQELLYIEYDLVAQKEPVRANGANRVA